MCLVNLCFQFKTTDTCAHGMFSCQQVLSGCCSFLLHCSDASSAARSLHSSSGSLHSLVCEGQLGHFHWTLFLLHSFISISCFCPVEELQLNRLHLSWWWTGGLSAECRKVFLRGPSLLWKRKSISKLWVDFPRLHIGCRNRRQVTQSW